MCKLGQCPYAHVCVLRHELSVPLMHHCKDNDVIRLVISHSVLVLTRDSSLVVSTRKLNLVWKDDVQTSEL